MTNLDAKVAWQRLYVELKAAKDREMADAFDSISHSLESVRIQNNQNIGMGVNRPINCKSTKLGQNIYTTCQ
jgi:hypothetical protein